MAGQEKSPLLAGAPAGGCRAAKGWRDQELITIGRMLVALCRPCLEPEVLAPPASKRQIADDASGAP